MTTLDIKIPQMGEGLTEVRLLQFLKRPGDLVARDELIYTMETDKATLEVESPESGTLSEWLAAEGDILPVGAAVARISQGEESERVVPPSPALQQDTAVGTRAEASPRVIPPRTRSYARERGITEADLARIPSAAGKLMPEDIDAYLAAPGAPAVPDAEPAVAPPSFRDHSLSDRQRKLNFHLKRSAQTIVPGTISRPVPWGDVRDHVTKLRERSEAVRPTEFQTFAYCAAQAVGSCPKFLCALVAEDTVRQYAHLHLGVAVSLPDGDLATAVVHDADQMAFPEFVMALKERIESARAGIDQADAYVQMLLSYLGAHGVRDAVPALVAPASSILFIGDSYSQDGSLFANVALTFDHRLINGVEAAELLNAIVSQIRRLGETGESKL